jgi:hypothetical protein
VLFAHGLSPGLFMVWHAARFTGYRPFASS